MGKKPVVDLNRLPLIEIDGSVSWWVPAIPVKEFFTGVIDEVFLFQSNYHRKQKSMTL